MKQLQVNTVDKRWLSNKEAQKYLGVGEDFFKRLRATASIHFYKVGNTVFYSKRDVDRLIERGKVI